MRTFAYSLRTDKRICTKLGILIPWGYDEISEGQKLREIVCVRVPVKMFTVARKLSKIEDWRQDQSCFEVEITGTKPQQLSRVQVR